MDTTLPDYYEKEPRCQLAYLDGGRYLLQENVRKLLKKDVFGRIFLISDSAEQSILRDASGTNLWIRPIARWLIRREARALAVIEELEGTPSLIDTSGLVLRRSYLAGDVMQLARPRDAAYFRSAAALLRRMHRLGVVHNDLAKEPNWLVTPDGSPAILDFQLASFRPRRGYLFRILAREDIRHLLKHKRTYRPDLLSTREQNILDNPAAISKIWMQTGKRLYLFVTRRILGWKDREDANERS
jgi:predicted Ser/Thr protein kinase